MNQELNPEIYITVLSGKKLNGDWIDPCQSVEALEKAGSDSSGWIITDSIDFGDYYINGRHPIKYISESALFIQKYGKLGADVLNRIDDVLKAEELIDNHYQGTYKDRVDFIKNWITDLNGEIPNIAPYIDYERMATDYFISDFFSIEAQNGEHHVFF